MKTRKKLKKAFVKSLVKAVTDIIASEIDLEKIPDDWDNREIRHYLSDAFTQEADAFPLTYQGRNSRARKYRNTKIVNNLRY